jgi:MFS-type transporter involved in bile tolerance (Atg22 family)
MGAVHLSLMTQLFLFYFGMQIGLSKRAFAVLVALRTLGVSFQLLGAHLTARMGERRRFWFFAAMSGRFARALAVAAAYWLSDYDAAFTAAAFVAFIAVGKVFNALAVPPWNSWLADLVPPDEHGRFMGRRSAWTALAVILAVIPCAVLVDWWSEVGMGAEGALLVFCLGAGVGFLDLFIHRTIPEPAIEPEGKGLLKGIAVVLRDRNFRSWLLFRCVWQFSVSVGGAMAILYMLGELGFERNLTTGAIVMLAVPQAMTVFVGRHFGGLIDRLGTRPVLTTSHFFLSLKPVMWFLAYFASPPAAVLLLLVSAVVGGTAQKVAQNAGNKLMTRLPRREDRSMYMAVSTCLACVAGAAGAVTAGEVLHALEGWSWRLAGAEVVGFHVLFGVSVLLRLTATGLTRFLPAPKAERAYIRAAERGRAATGVA